MGATPEITDSLRAMIARGIERAHRIVHAIEAHATEEAAVAIFDVIQAVAHEFEDDPDRGQNSDFEAIGLYLGMIYGGASPPVDAVETASPTP